MLYSHESHIIGISRIPTAGAHGWEPEVLVTGKYSLMDLSFTKVGSTPTSTLLFSTLVAAQVPGTAVFCSSVYQVVESFTKIRSAIEIKVQLWQEKQV